MTPKKVRIVMCGAGPAKDVGFLVDQALAKGWSLELVATEEGLKLIPINELREKTGQQIVSEHSDKRRSRPDIIIVAPATTNTIAKLGIGDTYAASVLNEAVAFKIPMVILPSMKESMADRPCYKNHIRDLREEGVKVLIGGNDGIRLTDASSGDGPLPPFLWDLAITAAEKLLCVLFLSLIFAWLTALLVIMGKIHYCKQLPTKVNYVAQRG